MSSSAPAHAQEMHAQLAALGLVGRVQQILESAFNVLEVTDVLCWVVVESDGKPKAKIRVAYKRRVDTHTPNRIPHAEPATATFAVSTKLPFGPLGNASLTRDVVDGVWAIADRYCQ